MAKAAAVPLPLQGDPWNLISGVCSDSRDLALVPLVDRRGTWKERKPTGVELRSLVALALEPAGELVAGCEDLLNFAHLKQFPSVTPSPLVLLSPYFPPCHVPVSLSAQMFLGI